MNKKTLYLHIGFHKTGSTSLQRFLCANAKQLLKAGYLYPKGNIAKSAHYGISETLAKTNSYTLNPEKYENDRKIIFQQIESIEHENLIISSESLSYCDPKKVHQLFPSYHVKIIAYLRNYPSYVLAMYNQAIRRKRSDYTGTLKEFITSMNDKFLERYSALFSWAKIFGPSNITVIPFEKEQLIENDLIKDFLNRINLNNKQGLHFLKKANASVRPEVLYLIRAINLSKADYKTRREFIKKITAWDQAHKKNGIIPMLTKEIAEPLIEASSPTLQSIAQKLLHRENGKLFVNDTKFDANISQEEALTSLAKTAIDFHAYCTSQNNGANKPCKKRKATRWYNAFKKFFLRLATPAQH